MDRLPPAFLRGLWSRFLPRRVGVRPGRRGRWRDPFRPIRPQPPDPTLQTLRLWRPVAIAVLVCFSGLTLEPWQYLLWWKSSTHSPLAHAQAPVAPSPEAQLAQLLKDLEQQGRKLDEKVAKGQDATPEAHWFGQAMSTLASLHGQMQGRFKEIEKQIAPLPAEIHLRHQQAVLQYEQHIPQVQQALSDLAKEATPSGKAVKAKGLADLLQQINPQPQPIPLDPHNLPVRSPEATPIPPRTTAAEYALTEGIKLASADPQFLLAQAATAPPTAADLAETIEVPFTPEIRALAEELDRNPVQIYNFVRNAISFVPTWGSIQGAHQTLLARQGNAFDQASLLIALLRVSGIPARYQMGTIEVPIAQTMNWVGGVTEPQTAVNLLATGGIPVKGVVSGGSITKIQMEHIWVRAYVDFIPSDGAQPRTGDTWVPLDAAYKQHTYPPGLEISQNVPPDAAGFISALSATAMIDPTLNSITGVDTTLAQSLMDQYANQVDAYISSQLPNAYDNTVLGTREIHPQNFPILMATLPYRVLVRGSPTSQISDTYRHKVQFSIMKDPLDEITGTPLNYTVPLASLVGKRVTLLYTPATAADRATLTNLSPQPHPDGTPVQLSEFPQSFPAYLIQLKPELRIDGQLVASGSPLSMGQSEPFTASFGGPVATQRGIVTNTVIAGEAYGLVFHAGGIDSDLLVDKLLAHQDVLETGLAGTATLTRDQIFGEFLHLAATAYFAQLDAFNDHFARLEGVVYYRLPSFGFAQTAYKVNAFFGIPVSVSPSGLYLDIDRSRYLVVSKSGDSTKLPPWHFTAGVYSSLLEHALWEQVFTPLGEPVTAISAVKAIGVANAQGIPVYTLTAANASAVLPLLQLRADVRTDIQNALNAGKEVLVPQRPVTEGAWTGTGYIILDPARGEGAFQISGGTSGGFLFTLGSYWIILGSTLYDDTDPLYWLGIIRDGVNVIIIALNLWSMLLSTVLNVAGEIASIFFPWGKVLNAVGIALPVLLSSLIRTNHAVGLAYEKMVLKALQLEGLKKKFKVTIEGTVRGVIPDAAIIDALSNPTKLYEIKSGAKVYESTGNIRKLLQLAQDKSIPLDLIVRETAYVQPDLVFRVKATGGNVYKFIEKTGETVPY